jgi:hypothetical protein
MGAVSLIESVSTFLGCETTRSSLQTKHRHTSLFRRAMHAAILPALLLVAAIIPSDPKAEIVRLCGANAPEMVALTNLAFAGLFRIRTHEMGSFYVCDPGAN